MQHHIKTSSLSYKTIYQAVYAGMFDTPDQRRSQGNRGAHRKLRHRGKPCRPKGYVSNRGKIPISHELKERPVEKNERSRLDDWETDTIVGKNRKSGFLTLVDRHSRFLIAMRLTRLGSKEVLESVLGAPAIFWENLEALYREVLIKVEEEIGDGVERGYVNRDDLTKKNFIKLWNKPAYKSGNLARLLPNGEIAFHGRTDNQVKLRGLRVELGEIETVLNNFDGVKESIVVVRKNAAGDYLAGYFTAEKQIDLDELKKHLTASLTTYMVPSVLMQLDSFPLTANRKINKKALPEPTLQVEEDNKKIAATDLQKTLCAMFAKALGRKNIGADENFFEIGGTSLAASKVAMAAFLKKLPIVYADIFKYPTAEKLEAYILSQKITPSKVSAPAKVKVKFFLDEVFQIESSLEKNRVEYVDEIRHEGLGDVLLTGATGFLGIHVLYDLLKNTSQKYSVSFARARQIRLKRSLKICSPITLIRQWIKFLMNESRRLTATSQTNRSSTR